MSRRDLDGHTSEVALFCFHALLWSSGLNAFCVSFLAATSRAHKYILWSGGLCLLCLISRRDLNELKYVLFSFHAF